METMVSELHHIFNTHCIHVDSLPACYLESPDTPQIRYCEFLSPLIVISICLKSGKNKGKQGWSFLISVKFRIVVLQIENEGQGIE